MEVNIQYGSAILFLKHNHVYINPTRQGGIDVRTIMQQGLYAVLKKVRVRESKVRKGKVGASRL